MRRTTTSATSAAPATRRTAIRPPAVPLVTIDPYFSIWSCADKLTDEHTKHWTGAQHPLVGLLRVDGRCLRFLGHVHGVEAMDQLSVEVLPTRTVYVFRARGVELTLTFTTPALPDDLDTYSWPLSYVSFRIASTDGRRHECAVFFSACSQIVVDQSTQPVTWGRTRLGGIETLHVGSQDQAVLAKVGDNLRIDWGYLHLAMPPEQGWRGCIAGDEVHRAAFIAGKALPDSDDLDFPRNVHPSYPKPACATTISVPAGEAVDRWLILAYDDRWSIEYMHRRLRAYWRRSGRSMGGLLVEAVASHRQVTVCCAAFDRELIADARQTGGDSYASLCALSYRQCVAAHKLAVDHDGTPLYFSKENFSNGCIATVDVTYPSAPFFLLLNPALLEAQLRPVMDYAVSPRWRFPFAPHDLGCYPQANGQVYGGGERDEHDQMPVEECGNMLLLVAALCAAQGHLGFAERYWDVLEKWALYLRRQGFDPANQLCTDDFAGPMAHNANLSVKAILALGAWGRLCEQRGERAKGAEWRELAQHFVQQWLKAAGDGDHYRLGFDKPGSWSQKYNLVWDRLLGLKLFPVEVARKEVAFYRSKQQAFGLPLDNRQPYTKLDWVVWSATLTGDRDDFDALVEPMVRWAHQTPTRVPLTDWFWVTDGRQAMFQARSVVGGVFIAFLSDAALWRKWAGRAGAKPRLAKVPIAVARGERARTAAVAR
ncbi:MAG: DUF4965 domain-containing protein [Planctomycetes bacterium]|nr:DUF4965 domain-containing protein [Planctomycetota bacterium]